MSQAQVTPEDVAQRWMAYAPEIKREAAKRWLYHFFVQAWPQVDPAPLVSGWHLQAIAEHLEAVSRLEIRRLAIACPPGSSKSWMTSVAWPAWTWIHDPGSKWLTSSYSHDLSTRDAVRSRRLMNSAWYQANWGPLFEFVGDQNTKQRYENNFGGFRVATSVSGLGTGERAAFVVCDDPHNVLEIYSDIKRKAVVRWWNESMSTRIVDPATSRHVIIAQRIAEDDLIGHVLEQGGYEYLCLPMEYDRKRMVSTSLGNPDKRTKDGELLHPERFGPDAVEELKLRLGAFGAASQLQQQPSPLGGGVVKRSWWKFWDVDNAPAKYDQVIDTWDLAFKDLTTSDPVAGLKLGRIGAAVHILELAHGQMDIVETLVAVRGLAMRRRPNAILIEDKANGPAVVSLLQHELPGILPVTPEGGKEARVASVAPMVEAGNVLLPGRRTADAWAPAYPWVADLIHEAAMFPRGGHDDMVDALAQGLNYMRTAVYVAMARQRAEDEVTPPINPLEQWREEMMGKIQKKIKEQEKRQRQEERYGGSDLPGF